MDLLFDYQWSAGYNSGSQIARQLTEAWCHREMYCCACSAGSLSRLPNNEPGADFECEECKARYQLKGRARPISGKLVDAGYNAMVTAIKSEHAPNLLALHYNAGRVMNLTLVPSWFFVECLIERRRPLGPNTERANWVGCNILWSQIPVDGRIPIVQAGTPRRATEVRADFGRSKAFGALSLEKRGWTLLVLATVRELNQPVFTLDDIYRSEERLAAAFPANHHVRDKIRQQLQVLRDLGVLHFLGRGRYELN